MLVLLVSYSIIAFSGRGLIDPRPSIPALIDVNIDPEVHPQLCNVTTATDIGFRSLPVGRRHLVSLG